MRRLKNLRQDRDISIKQMLDFLNVSRTTYYNYENSISKPDFETLKKIANYFNVSIDYLLGRDTFADKLNRIRKEKNIDLLELSELTGIMGLRLYNFDTGANTPTDREVELIAKYLNVPVQELTVDDNYSKHTLHNISEIPIDKNKLDQLSKQELDTLKTIIENVVDGMIKSKISK